MKSMSILASFLLIYSVAFSQQKLKSVSITEAATTPLQPDTYIENPFLDKFKGRWIWKDGSKAIILNFNKIQYTMDKANHIVMDILKGDCEYYINKKRVPIDTAKNNLFGAMDTDTQPVVFMLTNKEKPMSVVYLHLTYIDKKTLKLQVSFKHEYAKHPYPDYIYPESMILKRD